MAFDIIWRIGITCAVIAIILRVLAFAIQFHLI